MVTALLDAGASVQTIGGLNFGGVLQAAVSGGHEGILERFGHLHADVNARGFRHGTSNALETASKMGYEHMVRRLLDLGAQVDPPGFQRRRQQILHHVLKHLQAEYDKKSEDEHSYLSALHQAFLADPPSTVQALIKSGVWHENFHQFERWWLPSESSPSALGSACVKGHCAIAETLIRAGANVDNMRTEDHDEVYPLSFDGMNSPITRASAQGVEDVIHPNTTGPQPWYTHQTALYIACSRAQADIVRLLIEHGAKVDLSYRVFIDKPNPTRKVHYGELQNLDFEERTALYAATKTGNTEIIETLLKAGADINIPYRYTGRMTTSRTALHRYSI
ncbi:ankyrin repeat-containing domain protein [Lophiotrema nucula]|uniref:Ankyrin repeat-containing domain protein n=1 Tax=Lophiotrema nucula TaxID=690887 RepID=A0A6A5YJB5_9PLEO|nr:ankyrin repeat-containing domain protein [Lophiotrema nucula]